MKKQIEWASSEDYKKVFKHLDERDLDTQNEYFYVQLLEANNLNVFRKDLKGWMVSLAVNLDTKAFKL